MSFTCKLFHPDGLNFALLWEPSPCFRLPSILLRGEIQGDKIRLLLFIRSIPGYCQFYGTWKYSNLQRKGLSVDFPIMCIYLKRKASGEKFKKKKSPTLVKQKADLSSAQCRHCSGFILLEETPMTHAV